MKRIRNQGFTLIELMVVLAIVGILSAFGLTSYQDYTVRTVVSEAQVLVDGAKIAWHDNYASGGTAINDKFCVTNAAAGTGANPIAAATDIKGKYVASVTFGGVAASNSDPTGCTAVAAFKTSGTDGVSIPSAAAGKAIAFKVVSTGATLRFECQLSGSNPATTVDAKYLPKTCI